MKLDFTRFNLAPPKLLMLRVEPEVDDPRSRVRGARSRERAAERIEPLLAELEASLPRRGFRARGGARALRRRALRRGASRAFRPCSREEGAAARSGGGSRPTSGSRACSRCTASTRESLAERVERGLEKVRPQLGAHGGDVHLVSVDEKSGVVRLRLDGTCDGCPASSATLELAVATAIRAEAPEVREIAVDGAPSRAARVLTGRECTEPEPPRGGRLA